MGFWENTWSNALGSLIAAFVLLFFYVIIQWFLAATDITVSYSWRFKGTVEDPVEAWPSFDIRNRSRSRTYYLGNVAYRLNGEVAFAFDNKSVQGKELRPGTITWIDAAPLRSFGIPQLKECFGCEVEVRLQNGRQFWLKGQGPVQLRHGKLQQRLFRLRDKLESFAIPTE